MIQTANLTLRAIDEHCERTEEEPFRRHLGASVIGDECARKLWYLFRWTLAEKFEPRMLRLFNGGHLEESRFIGWLRGAGVEVWEVNPDTGKQWRISDVDGHFGGSLDAVARGIPELGQEPFLCEFKTHNAKSFAKLQTDGLMRTKWKHFVQMQTYMFKMQLNYAVYFAVCKDDDALFAQIIKCDGKEGPRAIERARNIIYAETPLPRVGATPAHFACKYCHLMKLCHFGNEKPARNCRTCQWSRPAPDGSGEWLCFEPEADAQFGGIASMDEEAQRRACPRYKVNPVLIGRQP